MENNSTYYISLITKYFDGEANEQEILLLLDWIKNNTENQKIFEDYHKIWSNLEKEKIEKNIGVDIEWNKLAEKTIKIKPESKIISINIEKKGKSINNILKYAAVIAFIAVSSIFLYYYLSKPQTKQLIATSNPIESKLSDGTSVVLNAGSLLEYPSKFNNKRRNVKLRGEAYFDVFHDQTKPFIIEANNIIIEVLGTSFYVNTNNINDKVEVVLFKGKVAVYSKDKLNEKVILMPGEKIELSKNNKEIVKTVNNDENLLAWKTKKLIFNDEPIAEIVKTLNKVYHSNIQIQNANIGNCKITAAFDNQTLDAVLNVIEATVDVNIVKTPEMIKISGLGCK